MDPGMSTSFPMDGKRVRFSGDTNVGMKRDHNEDAFYLPVNERLAIVADGMGGHASGEVASRMAIDAIVGYFRDTETEQELTWPFKVDRGHGHDINRLACAIKLANQQIFEEAERKSDCHGMGTTVVSALFLDDVLIVGHVGDSRLYRIRDGGIEQLTEDHSLLNDYVRMKRLSESEIASFPHKNVIVRALGMKSSIEVDLLTEHPRLGDLYVLCSDGLSGMVSDADIAALATEEGDLDKLCDRLIASANANGGIDNITVVCARLEPL
jgi:serine/threonine protein phosphatase PrpC